MTRDIPMSRRFEAIDALLETIEACETDLDALLSMEPRASIPVSILPLPAASPPPSAQSLLRSMAAAPSNEAALAEVLATRIREARRARGWRQQDLADATGIARPNIARIESGRRVPKIGTLHRIAQALGMPLD